MKRIGILIVLLTLCACSKGAEDEGWFENTNRPVEIGRYQYIAQSNSFPPMILDTATGCLEQLEAFASGEKSIVSKNSVGFFSGSEPAKDRACGATGITKVPTAKAIKAMAGSN